MFSPIVQEKKGCLTTLEGKKQKEIVKCFGSQSFELCVFLTESARTEKCWSQASLASRPPGAAPADPMGNPLFLWSGEVRFCKHFPASSLSLRGHLLRGQCRESRERVSIFRLPGPRRGSHHHHFSRPAEQKEMQTDLS